jgi:hypothetical protein
VTSELSNFLRNVNVDRVDVLEGSQLFFKGLDSHVSVSDLFLEATDVGVELDALIFHGAGELLIFLGMLEIHSSVLGVEAGDLDVVIIDGLVSLCDVTSLGGLHLLMELTNVSLISLFFFRSFLLDLSHGSLVGRDLSLESSFSFVDGFLENSGHLGLFSNPGISLTSALFGEPILFGIVGIKVIFVFDVEHRNSFAARFLHVYNLCGMLSG